MLKKIVNNKFFKVFSYNSLVVFGKLITSFIVSKVSAIYLGPSGYAIVGNLKNVLQSALGLTASGFESGIIRYVSENKNDKTQLQIIAASVVTFSVFLSLIIGIPFFVFSEDLADYILKDRSLAFIFRCLAFLLPLISLNFLMIYIANGLQKLRLYTALVTVSNLLNAILTFLFVYFFNLKGALFASIIVPAASFLIGFLFEDIRFLFRGVVSSIKRVSKSFLKSISTYLLMATYSTILLSFSYLFIRNKIILNVDTDTAGLWEAMNKISSFYMLFFSSLLTLYLLPLLASNKTIKGYYSIMKSYFKYLIPIILILFCGLYIFRSLVVKIFLTTEFESIEQFFHLQLLGDFIKVLAFSIAYQFHAKKMVTFYFITDAILYVTFYFFGIHLLDVFDLRGVFYAYILSAFLYLIFVASFVFFNNNKYLSKDVKTV